MNQPSNSQSLIEIIQVSHGSTTFYPSLNGASLVMQPAQASTLWSPPTTHKNITQNNHPFQTLVNSLDLLVIKATVQRNPTDTVVKSSSTPDMHITARDFQDLISFGVPIYHELLNLSLETLCRDYSAAYLDPSFYPTLRDHGYRRILHRFAQSGQSTITQPSLDHCNIAIPIHVNGNHWLALCRWKIDGVTYFFYADDLNQSSTEQNIRAHLSTVPGLVPKDSVWINCDNYTYYPHSNECGPRTILALAIFISHPSPSCTMLTQYMNPMAMQSRTWMSHLLLTGSSPLIPPQSNSPPLQTKIAQSTPYDLVPWSGTIQSISDHLRRSNSKSTLEKVSSTKAPLPSTDQRVHNPEAAPSSPSNLLIKNPRKTRLPENTQSLLIALSQQAAPPLHKQLCQRKRWSRHRRTSTQQIFSN